MTSVSRCVTDYAYCGKESGDATALETVSPLRTGYKLIDLLLLFVPLAFIARYLTRSGALLTFSLAAVAVIPLAGALGESTGELATHVGTRVGALVNATMGNASELIIGVALLSSGHTDIARLEVERRSRRSHSWEGF